MADDRGEPERRLSLRCPDCGYWLDAAPRGGLVRAIAALLRSIFTFGAERSALRENLWCWKCHRTVTPEQAVERWVEVGEWDEPE